VQAIVSALLVVGNFVGWWFWNGIVNWTPVAYLLRAVGSDPAGLLLTPGGVQEAFQKLLSLAVVLQLVPFLYMFAALIKVAVKNPAEGRYSRKTLMAAGLSGFVTTTLGIALVFFPAQQITSLWSYEVWMFGGTAVFIGLAAFFFFVYGSRKSKQNAVAQPAVAIR
jgi:hypothetical protein